jgi:predicted alpha/beta-hydrolase family hydrolase
MIDRDGMQDREMTEYATPRGPALVDIERPAGSARSLLVLCHGAGGGVEAPDLVAVAHAVRDHGVVVARVTQPYRVAGRRSPAPANHLDEAWIAVVTALRRGRDRRLPLIVGGRSSGARVACRTAAVTEAQGVLALAFPLHPPGRPERSRDPELRTGLPTLVVNGDRDPFGMPEAGPDVEVAVRPGAKHDLRVDLRGTSALVVAWLCRMSWAT